MRLFALSAVFMGIACVAYSQIQVMSYTNQLKETYPTEIDLQMLNKRVFSKDSFFVADKDILSNTPIPKRLETKLLRQGLLDLFFKESYHMKTISDSLSQFNFALVGRLHASLFEDGNTYILKGESIPNENEFKFVIGLNYTENKLSSAILLAFRLRGFRDMRLTSKVEGNKEDGFYLIMKELLSFHGSSDVNDSSGILKINSCGKIQEVE